MVLIYYPHRGRLRAVKKKALTLKAARLARKWTQEDLEAATKRVDPAGKGVGQRVISKIECAPEIDPMNSTVVLLETALELPRGTLVFGVDHSDGATA